jgi:hypothetical protein
MIGIESLESVSVPGRFEMVIFSPSGISKFVPMLNVTVLIALLTWFDSETARVVNEERQPPDRRPLESADPEEILITLDGNPAAESVGILWGRPPGMGGLEREKLKV